jgi:uncharacterized protein YdgA (DUF945 family)
MVDMVALVAVIIGLCWFLGYRIAKSESAYKKIE